jgi:hypothetical protein
MAGLTYAKKVRNGKKIKKGQWDSSRKVATLMKPGRMESPFSSYPVRRGWGRGQKYGTWKK